MSKNHDRLSREIVNFVQLYWLTPSDCVTALKMERLYPWHLTVDVCISVHMSHAVTSISLSSRRPSKLVVFIHICQCNYIQWWWLIFVTFLLTLFWSFWTYNAQWHNHTCHNCSGSTTPHPHPPSHSSQAQKEEKKEKKGDTSRKGLPTTTYYGIKSATFNTFNEKRSFAKKSRKGLHIKTKDLLLFSILYLSFSKGKHPHHQHHHQPRQGFVWLAITQD